MNEELAAGTVVELYSGTIGTYAIARITANDQVNLGYECYRHDGQFVRNDRYPINRFRDFITGRKTEADWLETIIRGSYDRD